MTDLKWLLGRVGKWGLNCWYICYCSDTRRPDRKINVTRGRGGRWGNLIMMTLASLRALISRTWKDIFGFFNTLPKCQCFACRVLSGLWSPGVYLCPCCREPLSPQWWPDTDVPCLSKLWVSLAVTACSQGSAHGAAKLPWVLPMALRTL